MNIPHWFLYLNKLEPHCAKIGLNLYQSGHFMAE